MLWRRTPGQGAVATCRIDRWVLYCALWVVRVQARMEGLMLLPTELLVWAGNLTTVALWRSQVATHAEGQVELWALQRYQKSNQSFLLLAKDQPRGNGA